MRLLGSLQAGASLFKKWLLPAQKPIAVQAVEAAPAKPLVAGTEPGWLRVCNALDLLQCVKADKALAEIWRQSRQSEEVWKRDLLPAIHRYAEFVQLMPASEAHHHAHAGGLLSHTIEMLLVSMTRRNAYLLPEGSPIEIIDAQRDQWTYVVFFAALLHDIAKPMTDLRIQWRCDGMADSVRWMPAGGSLHQIMDQRKEGEYLVDFAPKSQRDYTAHTRLAQTLLPRIAPASALSFLSRYPQALVVLENYLCGQDKESLVAKIVKSADSLSTKRALTNGSKARFATSKAVPLIDLMMHAISSMLQAGTVLPLNRNGAAGWVFEGAVWFVAKRLADSVREWVKAHEPEEAIPGQAKNDRLFDTWQDYGVIDLNPVTGQAIWYVEVHGSEGEQGGYVHEFSMLRFPLPKLFQSESQYPAAMRGHLVLKDKRKTGADHEEQELAPMLAVPGQAQAAANLDVEDGVTTGSPLEDAPTDQFQTANTAAVAQPTKAAAKSDPKLANVMRSPSFNKAPAPKPTTQERPKQAAASSPSPAPVAATPPKAAAKPANDKPAGPVVNVSPAVVKPAKPNQHDAGEDAYLLDEDSPFLAKTESARAPSKPHKAAKPPTTVKAHAAPAVQPHQSGATATPAPAQPVPSPAKPPQAAKPAATTAKPLPKVSREFRNFMDEVPEVLPRTAARAAPVAPAAAIAQEPVLLLQQLPKLPGHEDEKPPAEPSELAVDFMRWLQQGLVSRELKYNETGAAVHFVPEGMALVSPRIFKDYAAQAGDDTDLRDLGTKVQRELIKCGWHLPGPNRTNIVKYAIHGRGSVEVGTLSCVVLVEPGRWVQPVPPSNPALVKK